MSTKDKINADVDSEKRDAALPVASRPKYYLFTGPFLVLLIVVVGIFFLFGRATGLREPKKQLTVEHLTKALDDTRADVRREAAQALGKMGTEAETALPKLKETLKDTSEAVRREAAEAIGHIGSAAKDVLPMLEASLKDSSETVKAAAKKAIERIKSALNQDAKRTDLQQK